MNPHPRRGGGTRAKRPPEETELLTCDPRATVTLTRERANRGSARTKTPRPRELDDQKGLLRDTPRSPQEPLGDSRQNSRAQSEVGLSASPLSLLPHCVTSSPPARSCSGPEHGGALEPVLDVSSGISTRLSPRHLERCARKGVRPQKLIGSEDAPNS